jgi:hypothetical protein
MSDKEALESGSIKARGETQIVLHISLNNQGLMVALKIHYFH